MDPARWSQVKQIFQSALDLPRGDRSAYIRSECGGDLELLQALEALLASEEISENFLEEPAVDYVGELPDVNIGRKIGPYQIVREIGVGGMGAVYLAERTDEFRQQVALKLMALGTDSRMVVSRFRHERQILAGLEHPNIARLLDGGATSDGRPYFVMEYVEGEPIDTYCARVKLNVARRLRLFQQVCSAVQHAHQNLIVHRDIKPGNILVSQDGTPKLLDFGIAKLVGDDPAPENTAMTEAGMRLMTPEYASPEQVRGLPITTATDIYSLGVVLFELLAGRMPYQFETRSPAEVEHVICQTNPTPPSRIANSKRLAGDLDTIVLKALEKDPRRRYASVEQFSDDIRRHLEGIPILARAPTLRYRTAKFVRRNRTAVAAGILVFLSLTGGLIATTWEAHVARQQRARAERRFDDVRHLAESFLFEFHDKIKNLPGSTPARQLIVQRALEYLRSLEQEVRGNAPLECELADAYLKVGDVQGNQYVSNLGDTAGALASYRQALAISEEVLRSDAKNVDALRYNSRAHRSIGEVLPLQGDATGALPHFRQSISAMERVTQAVPQDAEAHFELSTCYEMMGDVLGHSGLANLSDPNAARAAYEKALAIDQEALARDPSSVRARRGTAMMRMKVGDMELDPSKALADYQASEVVLEALSNADPVNGPLRRSLAMIERKIGNSYEALNQNKAALEQYRKASAIGRQLLLADEKNVQARLDYSVGLKTRADLLYKTGDHRGALELYRETLAWIQPLYQAESNNPLLQSRYSEMLVNVGEVLAELHQENEARPLFLRGLAITKEMADHPGATADSVMQYAEDLMDCPLEDLRSPDTALKYARRAVTMMGQPGPDSLEQLARAFFQANDPGSAIEFERKAMAMMPEASRKNSAERLARYQSKLQQLASPAHR